MRGLILLLSLLGLALQATAQTAPSKPPLAPVHTVTTTYFGVNVADPYRYMENRDDPAVTAWIGEQSEYARAVLDDLPGRAELLTELNKIDFSEPARLGRVAVLPGDRYIYLKQAPGRRFFDLYERDGLTGKPVLLIDPRSSGFGGAADSRIRFFSPSFDSSYIVYGISSAGSKTITLHILNAGTDSPLPDAIKGVAFPIAAWMPDGRSFLYCRYVQAEPGAPAGPDYQGSRIYLHRLGTNPSGDTAVFGAMAPKPNAPAGLIRSIETAPGSNYVVAAVQQGSAGSVILYAAPLALGGQAALAWKRIGNDHVTILGYRLRGNELFLFVNGLEGPVVARVSLQSPGIDHWGLMLQLTPAETVTGMQAANDAIYLTVVDADHASLMRLPYGSPQNITRVALPFQGSVRLYDEDPRVNGVLTVLSSWTRAPAVYRYDAKTDAVVRTGLWRSGPYDDPTDLIASDAEALGPDGTFVPLTILSKKGLQRDGTHPALLLGYSAYALAQLPAFRPRWRVWLDRGGVLAFVQVSSPSRYKDFLTCAQYLVDQGYTSPARLAGMSGETGAILIGRAITTDPELFRAAVIESGLLDPLRYEDTPDGGMDAPGLGGAKTLEGFRSLESVSSYEHVEQGVRYPAVLLETGMKDASVPVWQSAKMAARMEADSTSGLPVLLNIEKGRMDSQALGAVEHRNLFADEISFLFWQLGEPGFQPPPPVTTATR